MEDSKKESRRQTKKEIEGERESTQRICKDRKGGRERQGKQYKGKERDRKEQDLEKVK